MFSQDKVLPSPMLNRLGAQVFRTIVARALYKVRRVDADPRVARDVAELKDEGMVVLPQFLTEEHFARVREECGWLQDQPEHVATSVQGSTSVEETSIGAIAERLLPSVYAFYDDARLRAIVECVEQRPIGRLGLAGECERVVHGGGHRSDPEAALHSDTFFNTHKAWLYLDDVDISDGPLAYVKRSHHLTPSRLSFIYGDSWMRHPADNPSRRITTEEQRRCGLVETAVTCRANTLVVINACGYHRRTTGQPGRSRRALHLSMRANPFAPHRLHARVARHPALYGVLRRTRDLVRP